MSFLSKYFPRPFVLPFISKLMTWATIISLFTGPFGMSSAQAYTAATTYNLEYQVKQVKRLDSYRQTLERDRDRCLEDAERIERLVHDVGGSTHDPLRERVRQQSKLNKKFLKNRSYRGYERLESDYAEYRSLAKYSTESSLFNDEPREGCLAPGAFSKRRAEVSGTSAPMAIQLNPNAPNAVGEKRLRDLSPELRSDETIAIQDKIETNASGALSVLAAAVMGSSDADAGIGGGTKKKGAPAASSGNATAVTPSPTSGGGGGGAPTPTTTPKKKKGKKGPPPPVPAPAVEPAATFAPAAFIGEHLKKLSGGGGTCLLGGAKPYAEYGVFAGGTPIVPASEPGGPIKGYAGEPDAYGRCSGFKVLLCKTGTGTRSCELDDFENLEQTLANKQIEALKKDKNGLTDAQIAAIIQDIMTAESCEMVGPLPFGIDQLYEELEAGSGGCEDFDDRLSRIDQQISKSQTSIGEITELCPTCALEMAQKLQTTTRAPGGDKLEGWAKIIGAASPILVAGLGLWGNYQNNKTLRDIYAGQNGQYTNYLAYCNTQGLKDCGSPGMAMGNGLGVGGLGIGGLGLGGLGMGGLGLGGLGMGGLGYGGLGGGIGLGLNAGIGLGAGGMYPGMMGGLGMGGLGYPGMGLGYGGLGYPGAGLGLTAGLGMGINGGFYNPSAWGGAGGMYPQILQQQYAAEQAALYQRNLMLSQNALGNAQSSYYQLAQAGLPYANANMYGGWMNPMLGSGLGGGIYAGLSAGIGVNAGMGGYNPYLMSGMGGGRMGWF